jgi:hypothetical protein
MATQAMGLSDAICVRPPQILFVCHHFQVAGLDAPGVTTDVVYFEATPNGKLCHLICKSMCLAVFSQPGVEVPVSEFAFSPAPFPTVAALVYQKLEPPLEGQRKKASGFHLKRPSSQNVSRRTHTDRA